MKSVEKYTPSTKKWTRVSSMFDERHLFCGCAFVNKIFVFGGCFNNSNDHRLLTTSSCLEFNTKHNSFKEITGINEPRRCAACVVYQGNIVVSGGVDNDEFQLNSVK